MSSQRETNNPAPDVEGLIESAAEVIYANFTRPEGPKPAWVPGGNSFMQDNARRIARAARHALLAIAEENGRLAAERDAWLNSAAQFSRNEDYYRGLVQQIGATIGREAYTADDGGVHLDVLCAKVPELVVSLNARAEKAEADAAGFKAALQDSHRLEGQLDAKVERLEAEAAALRGALERVAEFYSGDDTTVGAIQALAINRKIARSALNPTRN